MAQEFNPIKQEVDGKMAHRVVWSTKALDIALKGLAVGKKLVANPFYDNNPKLLKGELVFQRTPEEIEEFKRCMNDVIYFAEKYAQLMTPDGIQHIQLRDYQKRYLEHLSNNRLTIYRACRQSAKCVFLTTNVLIKITSEFWDRAGDKLKKSWNNHYYISKEDAYYIPLFEIYYAMKPNMRFSDKISKLIYKIIWKIELLKQKTQD